jgi:hypothetical protein
MAIMRGQFGALQDRALLDSVSNEQEYANEERELVYEISWIANLVRTGWE